MCIGTAICIKYFRLTMLKKSLTILIVLAALATIVFVYFDLRDMSGDKLDPWSLVSSNAAIVVEVSTFDKTDEAIVWMSNYASDSTASSFPYAITGAYTIISELAAKRKSDEKWSSLLAANPVICYTTSSSVNNSWNLILPLGKSAESDFSALIGSLQFNPQSVKSYQDVAIYENSSSNSFSALFNHCLLWSTSMSGIEETILSSMESKSADFNRMQQKLVQTMAKDVPIHFFFRDKEDWWHTDLINIEGRFQLSGFAHQGDSSASALRYVSAGNTLGAQSIIPSNASVVECKIYSSFEEGWDLMSSANEGTTASLFWGQAWKDLGDSCACDLNEVVLSWRGGEWGNFIFEDTDRSHTISFVAVKEGENPMTKLQPLLGADTSRYMGSLLFSIKMPQVFDRNSFLGYMNTASYGALLGHYVCFSSAPESLKALINQYHARSTFEHVPPDGQPLSGQNTGWFIVQQAYSISSLPEHFMNCFGNASPIRASLSKLKQGLYGVNILMGKAEVMVGASSSSPLAGVGKVELSSPIADNGPWFVKNHNSGELEILAQDQANTIYLIDQDGKVLWTKNLDGKIKGEVKQVDALKNAKLQLIFSTGSQLYLIDRNGNDMSGFPIKYTSPLKSDLYVFDYDRSKNYRIVGGLEDGTVFNYTVEGKTATGWMHQKSGKAVTSIHHIRVGVDDWLISVLSDNRIQCLRRNGMMKYEPKSVLTGYDGKSAVCIASNSIEESAITYYSSAGSLVRIKFNQQDGGVENDVPANVKPLIEDINGDGKEDFVFSSGNDIFIYDFSNKLMEKIPLMERPEGLIGTGTVSSRKVLSAPLSDGKSYAISIPGGLLREVAAESATKILLSDMDGDAKSEVVLIKGSEIKIGAILDESVGAIN